MGMQLQEPSKATESLARAVRLKSLELAGHLDRIARLCARLGRAYGLGTREIELLCAAAPLHDIGKIVVPDEILNKPGPLTQDEWEIMRQHTVWGAEMLSGASAVQRAGREIALCHHEHWDGSGYPNRLVGDEISLFARFVTLVDQYDALRSRRPYKPAFSHERTCAVLLNGDERTRPGHFDPTILAVFESIRDDFEWIVEDVRRSTQGRRWSVMWAGLPGFLDKGRELARSLPAGGRADSHSLLKWASLCV